MQTLALVVQYDGTNYAGWQIQPDVDTVQQRLQTAVRKISGLDLNIVGAGRTDAGVHSRGQVAHALLVEPFPIPVDKIASAINSQLPSDIKVTKGTVLDFKFNARKDATAREYSYSISNRYDVFRRNYTLFVKRSFNPDMLIKAAEIFRGSHDFTTFSKLNAETKNYVCKVELCEWERINELSPPSKGDETNADSLTTNNYQLTTNPGIESWVFHIRADRFVYGMVRSLVGAMLDAARGKVKVEDLKDSLEKCDRKLASPLASPHGLVLEKVFYPENITKYLK